MPLISKMKAVEKIYFNLDKELASFKKASQISCPDNCSLCCNKNEITASPLEFFPLAYFIYQKGEANQLLDKITNSLNDDLCILYHPLNKSGACLYYKYRGLICRLFGYAANIDKYGNEVLITCSTIKKQLFDKNKLDMITDHKFLHIYNYYMKLYAIDLKLATFQLSINQAIKYALESIIFYIDFNKKKIV